ncbi:hypothetical protein TEA_014944 [Camellia sinensis var. sinensis]|uniref:Chalcone-flavonone isomerase family protein n=1 Tax=Camellia sinensis var. sinensis TaxID=542762 RepID=A0A4S4EIF6_CAMSN|nr:hypothetical protein TEA_014944 [Camellia sinensis var. sinensis]
MLEEKIGELKKTISEKEEVILGLREEMREVIRQLCIVINYHWSRCKDLKKMLSKTAETSILDDFSFYEERGKSLQERKARQQQNASVVADASSIIQLSDNFGEALQLKLEDGGALEVGGEAGARVLEGGLGPVLEVVVWKGKTAEELTDSVDFFRDIVSGPLEKFTQFLYLSSESLSQSLLVLALSSTTLGFHFVPILSLASSDHLLDGCPIDAIAFNFFTIYDLLLFFLFTLANKYCKGTILQSLSCVWLIVLNPSDKAKPKLGQPQPQPQISPSHFANHSPRSGPVKSDISRTSSVGKLHVLKPARERNGVSPTAKGSLSPTSVAVAPSVVGSAPLRSPGNNPNLVSAERKPALTILEKRPTPQSKSRNDFFNLVRKKSMTSPSSAAPDPGLAVSLPVSDKSDETGSGSAPVTPHDGDSPLSDSFDRSTEKRNDMNSNGNDNASDRPRESLDDKHQEPLNNGKDPSSSNGILYSEEEEAAFLRSLGWEENAGEDEGLTEEEISSFYKEVDEYIKLKPSSRIFQVMQPKFLVPLNLRTGSVGGGASSGSSSSNSKLES